jgi:hypothetical protein
LEKEGERPLRRIVMLLGAVMVMLVVTAGVAVAVNKTCRDIPCRGSDNDDILHERTGSVKDRILGLDGRDRIEAVTFNADRDVLKGGRKGDRLVTSDGDRRDSARGGAGRDTCIINRGDSRSSCERLDIATADEGRAIVESWSASSTAESP